MKKTVNLTLLAVCFCAFLLPACDDTETYADKLRKEQEVINRFFDQNNRTITHEYPANGVFGEGQFFLDPKSGAYFHVIDSGNGRRATTGREVYVRYSNAGSLIQTNGNDSLCLDSNTSTIDVQNYLYFTYNESSTYTEGAESTEANYIYKSPGVVAPLAYVGDSAIVQVIVPFNIGSGYQRAVYEPVYIGHLFYDFRKEQGE